MIPPTLQTDRLVLRPMAAPDWPAYAALMMSERASGMGGPFSEGAAWGWFCADVAQWSLYGAGALMVDDRETGACLGQVGINSGPLFPEQELGWMLYPPAEGRGIAMEAAARLRDWARQDRQLPTLVSYIDPDNLRSRALAERLGAWPDTEAPRPAPGDLVYRHY